MNQSREKKIAFSEVFNHPDVALRVINWITLYRIVTFPLLLYFVATGQMTLFKWFLALSFFTDAIDGYLARAFNVTSVLGARLDSLGDDLTVLAALVALVVHYTEFIKEQWVVIAVLVALFFVQLGFTLIKYKKMSSFHTYLAKTAAVVSALFLLSVFFFDDIYYWLFYLAMGITALELIEEIILVGMIPNWKTNVKGIYWVMKKN